MIRFLIYRLLSAIPVLFVVSLVTFLIMWLVPGDISAEIGGIDATAADLQVIRERLGLDRPLWERALRWYGDLFRGDLGHSYTLNRSVVDAVLERLPVTLSLAGLALVLATTIGLLLGILASVRHNTWMDQGAMVTALVGLSIPDFWFGIVMIILFGVWLGWLPTGCFVPLAEDPVGWARSMVLPAFTLAITQMGVIARMTRSAMLDVLGQDYIRTARAKGMRARTVIFRHGLRNAMIPIVTVVGVISGGAAVGRGGDRDGVFAARSGTADHRRDPAPGFSDHPGWTADHRLRLCLRQHPGRHGLCLVRPARPR